jgi:hypothetical protein
MKPVPPNTVMQPVMTFLLRDVRKRSGEWSSDKFDMGDPAPVWVWIVAFAVGYRSSPAPGHPIVDERRAGPLVNEERATPDRVGGHWQASRAPGRPLEPS